LIYKFKLTVYQIQVAFSDLAISWELVKSDLRNEPQVRHDAKAGDEDLNKTELIF
jgi:hypothetical protein